MPDKKNLDNAPKMSPRALDDPVRLDYEMIFVLLLPATPSQAHVESISCDSLSICRGRISYGLFSSLLGLTTAMDKYLLAAYLSTGQG